MDNEYTVVADCLCGCEQTEVVWVTAPDVQGAIDEAQQLDTGREMAAIAVFPGHITAEWSD